MISQLVKSADWKAEKHVPVIARRGGATLDGLLEVEVSVGKGVPHPNTVEHHIAWIALYYVAPGSQLPVELARADFSAHGPRVFTEPVLATRVRLPDAGTLHAVAYCNLHGLWESELPVSQI